jgi:hypothetical protein
MSFFYKLRFMVILIVFSLISSLSSLYACTVPVFRYALEREAWSPDIYQVYVIHNGKLSEENTKALNLLQDASTLYSGGILEHKSEIKYPANIKLTKIDVNQKTDNKVFYELIQKYKNLDKPLLLLSMPKREGRDYNIIWEGELTVTSAYYILDSPTRRMIPREIAKGHKIIWLFIDGDSKKENEEKLELLNNSVASFSKEFNENHGYVDDPANEGCEIDSNKVDISIIRLSNKDDLLTNILRAFESEFAETKSPSAFAIFGRGRVLGGCFAKSFNKETIEQACSYITGDCSCEIKQQNPGVDLLVSADWYKVMAAEVPPEYIVNPTINNLKNSTSTNITSDKVGKSFVITLIILTLLVFIISVYFILKKTHN